MWPLLIPTGKIYPQSSRRLQPSHAIWVRDCLSNVLLVSLYVLVLSKTDAVAFVLQMLLKGTVSAPEVAMSGPS